jgi:hypothetical protein
VLSGSRMLWPGKLVTAKARHSGCRGGRAGCTLLKDRFCRLFSVTIDKNAMISDILKTDRNRREWLLNWRRPLFTLEDEQLKDLISR